jgi:tellurite resistance protein
VTHPKVDLGRPGWLGSLLDHYLERYEAAEALARIDALRGAHPDLLLDTLADRLAQERLGEVGLRIGTGLLLPTLRERTQRYSALPETQLEAVGLLSLTWDLLQDVALLARDAADTAERRMQLLTLMALGREDYTLAREIHARRHESAPRLRAFEEALEQQVAPKGRLEGLRPTSTGIGLLYLHSRVQARIAARYYDAVEIEEHGIALLHHLSRQEKLDLVRIMIALAWVDGVITPEERQLITQQIEWAGLEPSAVLELELRLQRSFSLGELSLSPMDKGARQFVLEQAVLVTLVDDDQADSELAALEELATRLGGNRRELERALVRVTAFYLRNREAIRAVGAASSLGRLHRLLLERAQAAVRDNVKAILQEIRETGELAVLLGAASRRPLSKAEARKVKTQLTDIAKTVPALAIFAIPGGSFLLPVLIKALPFNVLPSAFAADDSEAGRAPLPRQPSE